MTMTAPDRAETSELEEMQARVEQLIDLDRFDEAESWLQRAIQIDPDAPYNHVLGAQISFYQDRYATARHRVYTALAREPEHFGARLLLCRIHKAEEDYALAEEVIIELIREYPEDGELYAHYAHLMLLTFHLDKAEALLAEARRHEPGNEFVHVIDMLLNLVRGRTDLAEYNLSQMVKRSPDAEHVIRSMFIVLIEQNRHREALEIGRRLLRIDPNDEDMVDLLVELRSLTHWSMLPWYPTIRWGYAGVAVIWGVGLLAIAVAQQYADDWLFWTILVTYFVWIALSWLYPPVLTRLLKWRGF